MQRQNSIIRQGRVMIVDDRLEWREQQVEILQEAGIHAECFASIEEAEQRLRETYFHLLILDIRFDDCDINDVRGMDFLQFLSRHDLPGELKVIIHSAYGTIAQMREAFRDLQVLNFISKVDFQKENLLEIVRGALANVCRINLGLHIEEASPDTIERAIAQLAPNTPPFPLQEGPGQHCVLRQEFEDLLCRLFYQWSEVFVKPLTQGFSGASVLRVQPFSASGPGREMVVKFGNHQKIKEESNNYKTYVHPFLNGYNADMLDIRHTPHLAGVIYSQINNCQDFGTFYQHANVQEIIERLKTLFEVTCQQWYANLDHIRPYQIADDYQEHWNEVLDAIRPRIGHYLDPKKPDQLLFPDLQLGTHLLRDPLPVVLHPHFNSKRPMYSCITHGDFNSANLLLTEQRQIKLIDFLSTGRGHFLRDIAALDAVIRLQLLRPEEATLQERFALEEVLNAPHFYYELNRFPETLATENSALAKAYAVVVALRKMINKLVTPNILSDMSGYFLALLYNALYNLSYTPLPQLQHEHALLAASLLLEIIND